MIYPDIKMQKKATMMLLPHMPALLLNPVYLLAHKHNKEVQKILAKTPYTINLG